MPDAHADCDRLQRELRSAKEQLASLEAARQASQQRFEALIEQSVYAYVELDTQGRIVAANARLYELFGGDAGSLVGRHFSEFVVEGDLARAETDFRRAAIGPLEGPRTYAIRDHFGDLRTVSVNSAALRRDDRPWRVLNLMLDVTQRIQTERALRTSEAQFRQLFENLPDFVLVVNRRGQVQLANLPGGLGLDELRGATAFAHLDDAYRGNAEFALEQALASGQPQETEVLDRGGHWWVVRTVAISEPQPGCEAMVICTETTERHAAQEALEREREALRRMLELYEQHRQLAAFEIHDGIAQPLTMAAMSLETALGMRQPGAGCGAGRAHCSGALEMLRESLVEARRQMAELRPSILDDFGVLAAIDNLVAVNQARSGTAVSIGWSHELSCSRLAAPLEVALFRIAQEALANALAHSGSPHVGLRLWEVGPRVRLEIIDPGRGFDPQRLDVRHVGLEGIRQRARLFGGQAMIDTAPGQGTRVIVDMPLLPAASAADDDQQDP